MTYHSLMKEKDIVNYILFIFILFSFFLGFYLDEDSSGGGKIDLIQHELNNRCIIAHIINYSYKTMI